jgi:hypothetical protein
MPMRLLVVLACMIGLLAVPVGAQDTGGDAPLQPIATPAAPAAAAPVAVFSSDVLAVLINGRTDLELLANQQLGTTRPELWSGSLDVSNPQLAVLLRLDLELLLSALVGQENMPADWFGAVRSTSFAIARDIRHDLELLADVVLVPNVRPPGWAGDNPLYRCSRSTQNLVQLLERGGLFTVTIAPDAPDYCRQAQLQASQFTEASLLNAPVVNLNTAAAPSSAAAPAAANGTASALEGVALAYLDRNARQRVGMVPTSVTFEPLARSLVQFSRMTLVRGLDFEVFVDYTTTSIGADMFQQLPDVNTVESVPFCNADWCEAATTAASTSSARPAGGSLVSAGTNMVIHYDGDDQNGQTRVRMQLCDRPTSTGQAICEPVTQVTLPDGSAASAVGVLDGLTQFYVPYAYTTTSVRSQSFYTADLWIDPPEARR